MADALLGILHLDRLIARAATTAVDRLDAVRCVIAVAHEGEVVHAVTTRHGDDVETVLGHLPLHAVPKAGAGILTGGTEALTPATWSMVTGFLGAISLPAESDPGTVAARPLRAAGERVGGMAVVLDHPYDDGDVERLEAIADRCARAVRVVLGYRERQDLFAELQSGLLPERLPQIDGVAIGAAYRPSATGADIGGDFYDAYTDADGRWTFAIGDVCGKGLAAAALTGTARSTLRAAHAHGLGPKQALELTNRAIHDHGDGRFCTLIVGEGESRADGNIALRVATGGHAPPLLVRADRSIDEVPLRGHMIGAFETAKIAETTTVLRPGDSMVLYTDGVTEARLAREQFGVERLHEVLAEGAHLPPDLLAEAVVGSVESFTGRRPHDDLTLLIIRAPSGAEAAT